MLRQININNFAIIENMSIDFNNGLTIITGQTGAGKSIVIDAIEQLLGQRASTNLIGSHSEQAILEGIFDVNDEIIKILSKYDIFIEDDYLIINKKISKEGKSQTRLNNKIITSEIVKSIAPLLVEIISQNEAILLNNYHNQIMYLDSFFNEEELKILNNYQNDYHKYLNIKNECHSFLNNVIDENLLNYYEEQLKEINEYYLDDEELNTLQTKEKYYNEYENINDYTYKIINIFHNDNIIDCLYDISNYSAKLKEIDVSFSDFDNNINDIYYLLKNSYDTILNKKQSLNYDEDEFTNLKQ
ncbi:MAG: AAA family ATPase, partial [Bacilli bacterium]|nr:AAA family ATPase [Bacilli bacterium]